MTHSFVSTSSSILSLLGAADSLFLLLFRLLLLLLLLLLLPLELLVRRALCSIDVGALPVEITMGLSSRSMLSRVSQAPQRELCFLESCHLCGPNACAIYARCCPQRQPLRSLRVVRHKNSMREQIVVCHNRHQQRRYIFRWGSSLRPCHSGIRSSTAVESKK